MLLRQLVQASLALVIFVFHSALADEPQRLPPVTALGSNVAGGTPDTNRRLSDNSLADNHSEIEEASTGSTTQLSDTVLQRLAAAEQRIAELERSGTTSESEAGGSDPVLFEVEFKDQLSELWDAHQEKKKSTRPSVSVFGRMHLEALAFPEATPGIDNFENPLTGTEVEDRIQFRRIRLGAQGKILETGIYRVEFDFGNPSRASFRDTYVGFEELPFLQTLLIGNQKRPLGLDSWSSNQHVVFFERPLVVNAFNPNYRRIGIESYGHSDDDNLNWQIGAFELQDVKGIGQDVGDPLHFSFNARVSGTPWYDEASGGRGYLHVGVSNMYASTSPGPSLSGNNGDLSNFSVRPELQTTLPWIDTGMGGEPGRLLHAGRTFL